MMIKNFTTKLVVSLAILFVANLYQNQLIAQEIKVYEGPYEKGYVKYSYYEDKQGERVWHGDFNFKVQSSDFTHSVNGSYRHGTPHGNYARITTKEDTRRKDSSEKLVKDEDNATIIIDQDGNQKVAYGTKKVTYTKSYGSEAVRYLVKGRYYEGKKEGIWTIEDESGIETYEFSNGETTKECKVDYPLDTRGFKHGTVLSENHRNNDFATEYYHGFPIYFKEYDESTGHIYEQSYKSDVENLKARVDKISSFIEGENVHCDMKADFNRYYKEHPFTVTEKFRSKEFSHKEIPDDQVKYYKGNISARQLSEIIENHEKNLITNKDYLKTQESIGFEEVSYNSLVELGVWVLDDPDEFQLVNNTLKYGGDVLKKNFRQMERLSGTFHYGKIHGSFIVQPDRFSHYLNSDGQRVSINYIIYNFDKGILKNKVEEIEEDNIVYKQTTYYGPSGDPIDISDFDEAKKYIEAENYKKALLSLQKAQKSECFNYIKSDILLYSMYVAYAMEDINEAKKYYEIAQKEKVFSNVYNNYIANCYASNKNYKEAEKYQLKYVAELEKNGIADVSELANSTSNLWWYQVVNGKLTDYNVEYPKSEYNPFLDTNKGNYLLLTDKYDEAISYYKKALNQYLRKYSVDEQWFKSMLEDDFTLLKEAGFKIKKNKVLKDLGLKNDYLKELSNY